MAIRINGDNTAAAPGITANDDTDTGIHFGTDEVNIVTGGTQHVNVNANGDVDLGGLTVSGSAADDSVNIDSDGRLLVGTSSSSVNASMVLEGDSGSATGASQIYLQRGQTAGFIADGSPLGVINFADNTGGRFARIEAEVDGTESGSDYPGRLVFSVTQDGGDSPVERLRISSNGRFHTSGVTQYFDRGSTSGSSSFTRDFQLGSSQTGIVMMGFSHYGHVNNYGCCRIDFAATGASFTPDNVHNQASGAGGSWTISKPDSSTLRVHKNAGSYNGSGGWFIHVVSS